MWKNRFSKAAQKFLTKEALEGESCRVQTAAVVPEVSPRGWGAHSPEDSQRLPVTTRGSSSTGQERVTSDVSLNKAA